MQLEAVIMHPLTETLFHTTGRPKLKFREVSQDKDFFQDRPSPLLAE